MGMFNKLEAAEKAAIQEALRIELTVWIFQLGDNFVTYTQARYNTLSSHSLIPLVFIKGVKWDVLRERYLWRHSMQPLLFMEPDWGITERSKESFSVFQKQLGTVDRIVITWDKEKGNYDTEVITMEGCIHLSGFAIGYRGEGPRGLAWLLEQCEIPFKEEEIFNPTDQMGQRIFENLNV